MGSFIKNQVKRFPKSIAAKILKNIKMYHDRMHQRNHACDRPDLDPNKEEALKGVYTESAEQFFAQLLKSVSVFKNTGPLYSFTA